MSRRTKSRKPMAEINVVPYIDVMLVLLVIFMITAPLLTQGVKVDLPQADSRPLEEDAKRPLVVTVDKAGSYFVTYDDDRTQPVTTQELMEKAAAIIRLNRDIPVLVKGDREVPYGLVVGAMVLLQQAGAPKVGLITEPREEPKKRR
ncbi:MAG: protein TolR [Gammaproteobacteria bacterium]|jgi:biopolymer transport protein TolR|nr:protein TolR [Gammaproteobacteria bacterium]